MIESCQHDLADLTEKKIVPTLASVADALYHAVPR